jgi:hypothetical protein
MGFTARFLRPLEQTWHEWFTEEYLATYFETARDVLLDAGVLVRNPDLDPNPSLLRENFHHSSSKEDLLLRRDEGGIGLHQR